MSFSNIAITTNVIPPSVPSSGNRQNGVVKNYATANQLKALNQDTVELTKDFHTNKQ